MAPPVGLEPTTPWLTVMCSTDWAKEECYSQTIVWLCLCWRWAILPVRRQTSIVASAELNFCVRNGNRWTLCGKNTKYNFKYQQWAILPVRRQTSIVTSAELNFCVRNGNRWTLCDKITDFQLIPDVSNKVNDLSFETETQTIPLNSDKTLCSDTQSFLIIGGSSPRSISIGQLNVLLRLHLRPIKLVVCKWPYSF